MTCRHKVKKAKIERALPTITRVSLAHCTGNNKKQVPIRDGREKMTKLLNTRDFIEHSNKIRFPIHTLDYKNEQN